MPRQPKWPPSVLFHRPSGQDRIRVNGKDYWLGASGSPEAKAEYARLVSELAVRGQAGPVEKRPSGTGFLVLEGVSRFLKYARTHYSPRGGQVVRFEAALSVVLQLHKDTPLSAFGAVELREVQAAMCGKGWCATTVNRHVIRVKTAWRWIEEEGKLAPPGSWAALAVVGPLLVNHPLYKAPPKRARTTEMEEVRAVCRHLPEVLRAALLFQWWTGARTSEVRIMRAGDVDTSGEVWTYRPREHKNDWRGHERVITVGPRARAALAPWLAACAGLEEYVFPPTPCRRSLAGGRPVEVPRDSYDRSRCYTLCGHAQAVRRAALLAGLPHFHAYLTRAATRMRVSREQGDEAARAVLGQKHLGTALNYGELDQRLARDAQARLG